MQLKIVTKEQKTIVGMEQKLEEYNRGMLDQYGAGCLTPEEGLDANDRFGNS